MKTYKNGIGDFTTRDWMHYATAAALRGQAAAGNVPAGSQAAYTQMYNDAVYMRLIATRNGRLTM